MKAEKEQNTEFRYKQLQDFETEVNWQKLVRLIANSYIQSGIGKLQVPLETMIRIYFLQRRYQLNAIEASLALSRIDLLREFALIDLSIDSLPEEKSIEEFTILVEESSVLNNFKSEFNIQPILDTINQ